MNPAAGAHAPAILFFFFSETVMSALEIYWQEMASAQVRTKQLLRAERLHAKRALQPDQAWGVNWLDGYTQD